MKLVSYETGYLIFGFIFLAGLAGYWLISRSLREPTAIYTTKDH